MAEKALPLTITDRTLHNEVLCLNGFLHLHRQNPATARALFEEAQGLLKINPWAVYGAASAMLMQHPDSVAYVIPMMEEAFRLGGIEWQEIQDDPWLFPLRRDPAFKALKARYLDPQAGLFGKLFSTPTP